MFLGRIQVKLKSPKFRVGRDKETLYKIDVNGKPQMANFKYLKVIFHRFSTAELLIHASILM